MSIVWSYSITARQPAWISSTFTLCPAQTSPRQTAPCVQLAPACCWTFHSQLTFYVFYIGPVEKCKLLTDYHYPVYPPSGDMS